MDKVSVCIATYNGGEYLLEQVSSILGQLRDNDEIVVSDDGSTDDTIQILQSFNDARIKIYKNEGIRSLIYNFENALRNASGEYLFLSDQDDVWFSDKVERSLFYLQSYDIVVSDCRVVDELLTVTHPSFMTLNMSKSGLYNNLFKNGYLGCCLAFRRNILNIALPFPKRLPMHDIWFGFIAEMFFEPYFLKEPLMFYRRHGTNASPTSEKSSYNILEKVMFRIRLLSLIPLLLHRRFSSKLKSGKK